HTPRKPSWPAVTCDRTERPDIWKQAIRSNFPFSPCKREPSTYATGLLLLSLSAGSAKLMSRLRRWRRR
ncbi:hypothetical protein EH199_20990, partial [Novosphingobium sp. LASN5T]